MRKEIEKMTNTPLNARTVTVKMKRIDLCDLLIACTALDNAAEADSTKWGKLHDKLKEILDDYDSKQEL